MGNAVEIDIPTYRLLTQRKNLDLIVTSAATTTAEVMIKNISKESGSGKAYKTNKGIGFHIASAPGDYPAKETGSLAGSIDVKLGNLSDRADVVITSSYALDLEYGTSRMQARPFIIRSLDEALSTRLEEIIDRVVSYINNNKPAEVRTFLESTNKSAQEKINDARAVVEDLLESISRRTREVISKR